ncbi:MAG: SUMF1/EgtB/PvdO family nonheme iron enzyme, partial [Caldilineaceae bacterium]|nr:SUMF1/EgtB/PvdO family nonheme iron enzyme [Caldilineaceae bacterium]
MSERDFEQPDAASGDTGANATNATYINSGGAVIEGDVNAGGDVAGRDIVTVNNYYQAQVDAALAEPVDPLADFEPLDFEPPTRLIGAGAFWMGRDPGPGVAEHETPSTSIELHAFRIGICPVTNGEFARFLEAEQRIA